MSLPLFAKFSIHIVSSIFIDDVYDSATFSPQELQIESAVNQKFNWNKFY